MPARSRAARAAIRVLEDAAVKRLPINVRSLCRKHAFVMTETELEQAITAARTAQVKLIVSLRETLELSRGLERFIPLRESLGLVLHKMPWVTTSPTIAKEKARLEDVYLKLGEQLDRGELKHAAVQIQIQRLTASRRAIHKSSAPGERAAI